MDVTTEKKQAPKQSWPGPGFRLSRSAKMVLAGYSGQQRHIVKRQLIDAEAASQGLRRGQSKGSNGSEITRGNSPGWDGVRPPL